MICTPREENCAGYPADVDDNALCFFGPERYHSDEFQDEAYLFIPFDEDYYWFFGHYHENRIIDQKYILQWEKISELGF